MSINHGNKTENTSFLDVLLSLKENIFKTLPVSDLYVVQNISNDSYKCALLTNENVVIECVKLQNLEISKDDVVLVTFTNNDFRQSLQDYKNGKVLKAQSTKRHHEKSYGVIVGIVYNNSEV